MIDGNTRFKVKTNIELLLTCIANISTCFYMRTYDSPALITPLFQGRALRKIFCVIKAPTKPENNPPLSENSAVFDAHPCGLWQAGERGEWEYGLPFYFLKNPPFFIGHHGPSPYPQTASHRIHIAPMQIPLAN
jgi:hypothetical protein